MIGTTDEAKKNMDSAMGHYETELKKVRTGRASASVLEGISVEVYGQSAPLQHVSNVNALDAQTLQITPFDPNNLDAISAAIRENQSLGLNPSDDGRVVRVPIPPMTEERRLEVVRQVHDKAEEAKISLRNVRHDLLKHAKAQEKDKEISNDQYRDIEKEATELIEGYQKKVDELAKEKEQEVMKV